MKQWYLYYTTPEATEKLHQLGAELLLSDFFADKATLQYGIKTEAIEQSNENIRHRFQGMTNPLALATYNGIKVSDVLPSEELLRQRVRQLEQELRLSRKLIHKLTEDDNR